MNPAPPQIMSLASLLGGAYVPSSFTVCGWRRRSNWIYPSPPARWGDQKAARRITTEGGGLSEAVLDLVDLQASLSGGNLDISPVLQCPGRKQPLIWFRCQSRQRRLCIKNECFCVSLFLMQLVIGQNGSEAVRSSPFCFSQTGSSWEVISDGGNRCASTLGNDWAVSNSGGW